MRLLLTLLVTILLAGCANGSQAVQTDPPPTSPTIEPAAPVVKADTARIAAPQTTPEQVALLAQGINQFGFDLYHQLPQDGANRIFSPYSISLAFSMVYGGARGDTESQMVDTMHFLPQEAHHPAFNSLDQHLNRMGENSSENGQAFQLSIANAVWGQQGFPFEQAYLEILAQHYGAGLQAVDFSQDAEGVRGLANQWVAEQTHGRIEEILPPESVDASTRLVLANAIYFKASWVFPFDPANTQDGAFHLLSGETSNAAMMHDVPRIFYTQADGYQAAWLPYYGQPVEMLVILPAEGRFAEIEERLSPAFLAELRQAAQEHDVTLTMPKFDFEMAVDLKELLSGMGMANAFSDGADFSGIGGGLFISAALHKGTITVDEEGTEAAAATAIGMVESSYPPAALTLDRPFIFAILERESGTVLFLGRVMNPGR